MKDNSSRRALITFAAVHDELLKSNDFLRGISPLFSAIAVELSGQPYRADIFQQRLHTLFGLRIPEDILALMPSRLQSLKMVVRRDINSGALYYWSYTHDHFDFDQSEFSDVVNGILTAFEDFLSDEDNLLARGWSRDRAEDVLFEFLMNGIDELQTAHATLYGDGATSSNARSEEQYIAARFVQHLKIRSSELFDALGGIRNALVLSEVIIELGTRHKTTTRGTDLHAYLDSPLMMDFLGLSGDAPKYYARQIVSGLQALGVRVSIFDHSIDEIKDNLVAMMSAPVSLRRGPTAAAIISREVEEGFVASVMHNPEHEIERSGIPITRNPHSTLTVQQRAYINEEDENQIYSDLLGIHVNQRARERDARSISFITARRGGFTTTNILKCKHLFITNNEAVSVASRQIMARRGAERDRIPPALGLRKVAAAVWLEVGLQDRLDIERHQLLVACARTAATNPALIAAIRRNLRNVNPANAEQYEAMISKPRYLQMSADVFLGSETIIDEQNSVYLFDTIKKDIESEVTATAQKERRRLSDRHRREIAAREAEIQKHKADITQIIQDSKESLAALARRELRMWRTVSNVLSVVFLFTVCVLTVTASYLSGLTSFWSIGLGLTIAVALSILSVFGIGFRQVQRQLDGAASSRVRKRLNDLGHEADLQNAIFDVRSAEIVWLPSEAPESPTDSKTLL